MSCRSGFSPKTQQKHAQSHNNHESRHTNIKQNHLTIATWMGRGSFSLGTWVTCRHRIALRSDGAISRPKNADERRVTQGLPRTNTQQLFPPFLTGIVDNIVHAIVYLLLVHLRPLVAVSTAASKQETGYKHRHLRRLPLCSVPPSKVPARVSQHEIGCNK
jgi:hypothetical protein